MAMDYKTIGLTYFRNCCKLSITYNCTIHLFQFTFCKMFSDGWFLSTSVGKCSTNLVLDLTNHGVWYGKNRLKSSLITFVLDESFTITYNYSSKHMMMCKDHCYFFLSFQKPNLPTSIYRAMVVVLALDGPNVWMHACNRKAHLFEKCMPMTFECFLLFNT